MFCEFDIFGNATKSTINWCFEKLINEPFANLYNPMQKIQNNCFVSKYFRLMKSHIKVFQPEVLITSFLHLMMLINKRFIRYDILKFLLDFKTFEIPLMYAGSDASIISLL